MRVPPMVPVLLGLALAVAGRGAPLHAQAGGRGPGARLPTEDARDSIRARLTLPRPPAFEAFGRLTPLRLPASAVAAFATDSLRRSLDVRQRRLASAWLGVRDPRVAPPPIVSFVARQPVAPRRDIQDTTLATLAEPVTPPAGPAVTDYADLALKLNTRLEAKGEKAQTTPCLAIELTSAFSGCRSPIAPSVDFQFNILSAGVLADRIHVDIDYDSQREFDASNNLSIYYAGKSNEVVQRVEVGNVTFAPPQSRFITGGIPSGNYGMQALGQIGPMHFRAIAAQQKGTLVKDARFTVGDRTQQGQSRDVEDYQIEQRRFFFTVDPALFGSEYPNIDILDRAQMQRLAEALPAGTRPAKVSVYRLQIGSQPPNPNGPRFQVRGLRSANNADQPYELLREGVDYYVDPSQLWIAMVAQPSLERDRLVIAYTVRGPDGQPVVNPATGGTPDVAYTGADQFANLLYDNSINPGDPAFRREIRSVYRVGGEDVQRNTINARIVAGAAGDQEKPIGGAAQTYLQLFGLAQTTNPAAFDAENRVWPRPGDANVSTSPSGGTSRVIRDYFVVFPSLQPFSDSGLAKPPNLSNAAIYSTPGAYLYSPQHPPSVYRMQISYQSQGGADQGGTLTLGAIQLRRNSERLTIDGVQLARGLDYIIDYELGRITFSRPDTLFPRPRTVTVQYEENPLFTAAPTNIFGLATTFAAPAGEVTFTVIRQGQTTQYTRPPLGFEPASSLVAGVTGNWSWDAPLLTNALARLPMLSERPGASRIALQAELATSRPQPNSVGQAWLDSFAGEGGIQISTLDPAWFLSSRPLESRATGPITFGANNAASLVWQTNVHLPNDSTPLRFTSRMIDRSIVIQTGSTGVSFPESVLWLTLQPSTLGFSRAHAGGQTQWITDPTPAATRRWRSIRTVLSPSGADLTQVEQLEFYALIDTSVANRARNPTLVFDLGEVSENTFALAPESLLVRPNATGVDSTFLGRQVVGLDRFDTERDSVTRSFSAALNDRGLPPDRLDSLRVVSPSGRTVLHDVPICEAEFGIIQSVGDARTNCTVRNNRLDEEDIDLDFALNFKEAERSSESYFRYVVDLAAVAQNPASAPRTACYISLPVDLKNDTTDTGPLCWVRIRLPLNAASDTVNSPQLRRIKALRLTMVSAAGLPNDVASTLPIGRFRLTGPLWLKRLGSPIAGIGGDSAASLPGTRGSVRVTTISTRDPGYTPPPGIRNDNDVKTPRQDQSTVEVNEQALRVTATNLVPLSRAEAYYRFPEGSKNFLAYRELRVWARGGKPTGWGTGGDLNFFVRMGRDGNNFYLYHTPAFADSWTDVRVDFSVLQTLRSRIQTSYLRRGARIGCSAVDSALIAKTNRDALIPDTAVFAACEGGYIAYTVAPGVTPPNLAAVQELAVGILRTGSAQVFNPVSDTLDLWVDDIRLRNVEKTPGYAGQIGLEIRAGGIADIRIAGSRRDAYFRQLAESPSYVGQDALDLVSTVRLEKLLPASLGLSLPVSIAYSGSSSSPELLDRSDLRASEVPGLRTPRTSSASYAISARRITPMGNGLLGAVLDNVTLNGVLATSNARSEYQSGGAKSWSATADYIVAAEPRALAMPGWFTRVIGDLPPWISESELGRAIRGAAFRWNPAQIRFTSGLARSNDDRRTFLKPASAIDDSGRVVRAESNLWRNVGAIELRPVGPLTLRWDATATRDLRDYASGLDTTQIRLDRNRLRATRGERGSLFGRDVGLERDRQMSAAASFAPPFSSWLKPRVDLGSTFTFVRDPNARPLTLVDSLMDTTYVLPRRFGNTQTVTTAAQLDLQTMGRVFWQRAQYVRMLSNAITPIDVSYSRSIISAFDNESESPGLAYQLALGGARSFRSIRERPATTAGLTNTVSAGSSVVFPYGFILVPRYSLTTTRSWYRRTDDQQDVIDGVQRDYPDLTLRWTLVPGNSAIGQFVSHGIRNLAASAGVRYTRVAALAPSTGNSGDLRVSRIRVYPINATIIWPFGDLSTTGGYSWSIRDDSLPGNATHGVTGERSADMAKSWTLPSRFSTRSPLRTRLGWQETRTKNVLTASGRSLTDNGRRVFSLSADTDLNPTMSFSLQGSRTATMDRNYNRRFVQTVITAALQLQFYAGNFR